MGKIFIFKRGIIRLAIVAAGLILCAGCLFQAGQPETEEAFEPLRRIGLRPETISGELFYSGAAPEAFKKIAGADYKPSFNEDPAIPAQCWIETGYGTQNACQYCHTDYLAEQRHGNAFPIADDQILFSFPTPGLNRILWRNIISPEQIDRRLAAEGVHIPALDEVGYVREDNWTPLYAAVRTQDDGWLDRADPDGPFALFPALNPNDLFPYDASDPTGGGRHGFVDSEGFVRGQDGGYTGWRAINFFPYAIFKPQTGSVSGIYIRLPKAFMTRDGRFDAAVYRSNLDLLERNIKNRPLDRSHYDGDAATIAVQKGFYPVRTEFAHPLHYVDLNADGEQGGSVNAVVGNVGATYEFPGTRSKRVKEIRYMYKWKEVGLEDIADAAAEPEEEAPRFAEFVGREGQGWVDNGAGWILAAYIENRRGDLRPQTTEELAQCIGCHANVGNTVDAVWSFQRKLPGEAGWREMDYGQYRQNRRERTRLHDYLNVETGRGELEYFYYTVVGADLYGVMSAEIAAELQDFARRELSLKRLTLTHPVAEIFDDEQLKMMGRDARDARLRERQRTMRRYAEQREYLYHDGAEDQFFIKGAVLYPTEATMRKNIQLYRKIVLDQSFNLGKDVFGSESDHVPFTFRSDGSVADEKGNIIAVGAVITSRPYGPDGIGTTPTGIVAVNADGVPVDARRQPVDLDRTPEQVVGHIANGGTFNPLYNPILSDSPLKK